MKLFKLFLFALALSFVAPQAIDAKPRKKHRTTRVKKSRRGGGCKHDWWYSNHYDENPPQRHRCCQKCGKYEFAGYL